MRLYNEFMKYALITGASSGLGKEFARQLHKEYKLILVSRHTENIEIDGIKLSYDLSKNEQCFQLLEEIKDKDIALCINNAGSGKVGKSMDINIQTELDMMHLNMDAMHIITKEMIKRNVKWILNVSSSAGLLPAGPFMATYYASKAYVSSYSQALAYENKDIYIGCLCPGPVDTNFNQNAGATSSLNGISAKECVEYTLKQMKKKKQIIIPTWKMKCAVFFGRCIPTSLLIQMTAHQQKKKLR